MTKSTFAFEITVTGMAEVFGKVIIQAENHEHAMRVMSDRLEDTATMCDWEIADYGDGEVPEPAIIAATLPDQRQQVVMFRVNVYLIDQAYGGGEEGGWWFSTGAHCADKTDSWAQFYDQESAIKARDVIQDRLDKEDNAHRNDDISSVNSEGRFEAIVQTHEGRSWPEHKPRYS